MFRESVSNRINWLTGLAIFLVTLAVTPFSTLDPIDVPKLWKVDREVVDTGGIGGTLAGNALSLASMRATLTQVLTEANFKKMIALGDRWSDGVDAAINEFKLPWHCSRLGARGEYLFAPKAPNTGREAADAGDGFGHRLVA